MTIDTGVTLQDQVSRSGATTYQVRFDQIGSDQIRLDQTRLDQIMNFGLLCTVQCTVVEVNVKVALLYSTKCNQTQRGGGGVVWCGIF